MGDERRHLVMGDERRHLVSEAIAGLKPYETGKPIEDVERELGVKDALKLASNENAWGPSPRAVLAIASAMESAPGATSKLARYPDGACFSLRQELASFHGVSMAEIVMGNGSNELIGALVRTFVQPGQSVASSAGSFVAYRIAARSHGHRFIEAPLGDDFGYDLAALVEAVDPTTRVVFIANPNNPTGTFLGEAALERFLGALDRKAWGPAGPPLVVLDEAYIDFVDAAEAPRSLELLRARPGVVLLRTFSKAYGLAALRVGYALCEPVIADYLNRVRDPFNVNFLGQTAARAALADQAWVRGTVAEVLTERPWLTAALTELGLHPVRSQANFVLVDLRREARAVNDALMRQGVIARPLGPAGFPNHLRVTIGRRHENQRFLDALRSVLTSA